jgi:hypothetical protein
MGGIGLYRVSGIHHSAWVSSWLPSIRFLNDHHTNIFEMCSANPLDIKALESSEFLQGGDINNISCEDLVSLLEKNVPRQKDLTKLDHEATFPHWMADLSNEDPAKAALLRSQATPGTSSWIYAPLSDNPALHLGGEEYREALRLRMLLPPHDDTVHLQRRCTTCRNNDVPTFHALSCFCTSAQRISRHNLIRDSLKDYVKAAVPDVVIYSEPSVPNPLGGASPKKADLLLQLGPRSVYVDVSITNPASTTNINLHNTNPADAARAKENRKFADYRRAYGPDMTDSLVPFVLECTGRFGPQAAKFIDTISGLLTQLPGGGVANPNEKVKASRRFFLKRVARILAAGNARAIMRYRKSIEILSTA